MLQALAPPDPPTAEIVITARALPDPASIRAFSVDRLDATRLRSAPSTQIEQQLLQVPGLQLFRRSDARSGHPTSQGITLRALGGNASSRAQLFLDGVPQGDPFAGWINWPSYDPAALAEVRVIRGGGSVVHGPGALAGVIEMISDVSPGGGAGLEAGTRNSWEARSQASAPLAGGSLSLSARAASGDGFVPITRATRGPADRPAPYVQGSVRGRWSAPLGGAVALQASVAALTDRRQRGVAYTGNRTKGADASLRLVGSGRWQWSALGYAQWREFGSSFASIGDGRADARPAAIQDAVPSRGLGAIVELRPPVAGGIELRVGADGRRVIGESRELYFFVAGEPTRRRIAGGQSLTAGIFSEATATLGKLVLSGGARLDHWGISDGRLRERGLATGEPLRDDRFAGRSGWLPTARTGAVVDLGSGSSLRSAAYLGWRLPTLNELFRPFRAGQDATAANPSLEPERLAGIEAGARFERGPASLSVTAFGNRLNDAIANVTLGNGPGMFPGVGFVAAGGGYRQRRNINSITVRGVEASAELAGGAWSARLGASLTSARVSAAGVAAPLDGLRPAQTPQLAMSGALGWASRGGEVSLHARHVGAQFEDDLNRRRLPSATTLDAFAALPLAPGLKVAVRAENLLDAQVVAGIGGDGAVERATPRTLWIGLRIVRNPFD
ncbi:MAG: TonB-dependent receptor [Pseudomonadota bacterium]|nr:TonB-dependent receptor [Pseudomonadota bacterium]